MENKKKLLTDVSESLRFHLSFLCIFAFCDLHIFDEYFLRNIYRLFQNIILTKTLYVILYVSVTRDGRTAMVGTADGWVILYDLDSHKIEKYSQVCWLRSNFISILNLFPINAETNAGWYMCVTKTSYWTNPFSTPD